MFSVTPDFYNQHKVAAYQSNSLERTQTAPANYKAASPSNDRPASVTNHRAPSVTNHRPASVANHNPSSSKKLNNNCDSQRHWLTWRTWNSASPEPPGLQKRLHRPWPTPEPVQKHETDQYSKRAVSCFPRPGNHYTMPVRPTHPVPDMLGSDGVHPSLTGNREQCFTPKPPNLPINVKHGGNNPLNVFL